MITVCLVKILCTWKMTLGGRLNKIFVDALPLSHAPLCISQTTQMKKNAQLSLANNWQMQHVSE